MKIKKFTKKQWIILAIILIVVVNSVSIGVWYAATYYDSGRGHVGIYTSSESFFIELSVERYKLRNDGTYGQYWAPMIEKITHDGIYYYKEYIKDGEPTQKFIYTFLPHNIYFDPELVDAINAHIEKVGNNIKLTTKSIQFKDSDSKFIINEYFCSESKSNGYFYFDMSNENYEMWMVSRPYFYDQKQNPKTKQYLYLTIKDNIRINDKTIVYTLTLTFLNFDAEFSKKIINIGENIDGKN